MPNTSQQYKKTYMANLKTQVASNQKNFNANRGAPATHQYMQNSGQNVIGASTFGRETNVQAKGTKWNGPK
jgi:hypothetical protein